LEGRTGTGGEAAAEAELAKLFTNSHQARIRRGSIAATIYGGTSEVQRNIIAAGLIRDSLR